MRITRPRPWLLAGVALALCGPVWAQDGGLFKAGVRTVAIYATARDRDGQLEPNLRREDFRILDNGKPVDITTFSKDELPFTAVLLLDMSDSMTTSYTRTHDAAVHFVDAMLPADRLRIGTFSREVALSPWLTSDHVILRRTLDEELWPGGDTPLWRALTEAMSSLDSEAGRRVVVVVTDGKDSGEMKNCNPTERAPRTIGACPTAMSARAIAVREGFMVYAIGLEGPGLDGELARLALETGGGHTQLERNVNLDAAFSRIADELHRQYTLGFTPSVLDNKTHSIEVRSTSPHVTVQARKSYFAGESR